MKTFYHNTIIILVILSMISVNNAAEKENINIMPIPANYEFTNDVFILDTDFGISVNGNPDVRIFKYATNILRRVSDRTGLFFKQDVVKKQFTDKIQKLNIYCKRPGKVVLGEDESYELKIDNSGISITSETDLGAIHALETLYQLIQNNEKHYFLKGINIKDNPRFKWRGLMIDVSRHFMPVDVIKRNLDAMSMVKMNVLHLHLSDNQSVRVESKLFPQLQEKCTDGNYFSQEQLKDIVKYAGDRGIRVIPEFDIPWHSTAWFVAFPELASAKEEYKLERSWGVFDPVFNPAIEETYDFFEKFFGEMFTIFPDDYFHIGGDEGTDKHWNENNQIQEFMKNNKMKNIQDLHNYFNLRILDILTKNNKKMVGWDEILQPEMPSNIVIQSWRGQKSLFESAKKGYMGILSNNYYIDLIQPTDFHYLNNPIPDSVHLSKEETDRILGGEATMWSELVTPETVDSRIWPRTAAIAERFWSPSNVNNVTDMYRRLDQINYLLEHVGITHIKNQDMMLRRISNNDNITPLKTLLEVIEPVKLYTRHSQGVKYTSYSPYTRVVDVAIPDVKQARQIRTEIDNYFISKDKNALKNLISSFTKYKDNHAHLMELINKNPIMKEIEPLSKNLSDLSSLSIIIINKIIKNEKINSETFEEYNKTIQLSKKPFGQVEIMFVRGIEKLIGEIRK